ncbi:MAG: hypothetical protein M3112_00290 [Actinomycetia bacterium]|nr:hypothetical protein [Actinomycetes bacterium]
MTQQYPYNVRCALSRDANGLPSLSVKLIDEYGVEHDTAVSPFEARHFGYMIISMASEVESQEAYITALRSRKEDEMEILDIMKDAAEFLRHRRSAL